MGRQTGVVRIRGKVGNLTFAKTANGDEVRIETSLNGDRMKTDPKFKRTRENWAEFARAGKAAKLIRNAFASQSKHLTDRLGYTRLVKHTMRIVKSDPINDRGDRQLINGDFNNLMGYEFNIRQNLESTFKSQFEIVLDRPAGTVDINIPELEPDTVISAMQGATHFKLVAAAAEFDWDEAKSIPDFIQTIEIPLSDPTVPAQSLNLTVPVASTKTLVVTMGVWFYQEVNGQFYLLSNGAVNAMAIVGVDNV